MTRRPKRNSRGICADRRRDMWSDCNTGSPGAADCRASRGERVLAEAMIEGVSAIAGVSEPSDEALNFILVAGPGGIIIILLITACARFPAGLEWCFFVPSGASGRSGDWKLSIEIKFPNMKSGWRLKRALLVSGPAIDRRVASWLPRRRAASDRIGGHRAIRSGAVTRAMVTNHHECQMTRNEHVAPVAGYLRLSGIDR